MDSALAPDQLFGRYRILEMIARGGNGEVYRALDTGLQREVAIKVVSEEVTEDPEAHELFRREAPIAASLNHPNIIRVYDTGVENGTSYIVSEFLHGAPVAGPMPVAKLVDVVGQISAGLAAMHQAGLAHRDLKPENIFLNDDGTIKIIDFGLTEDAYAVRGLSPDVPQPPRDIRSDQLAFGLIVYELASGRKPFRDPRAAGRISEIMAQELAPLDADASDALHGAIVAAASESAGEGSVSLAHHIMLTGLSVALALAGAPVTVRPYVPPAPKELSAEYPSHAGPYEILGLLSTGGHNRIFRAWDPRLQRSVSITLSDAGAIPAASLPSHANIAAVYDVGRVGNSWYVASELVEGSALHGPMPVAEVLSIGEQIASALSAAHRAGVVHGALSPNTAIRSTNGTVKLLSFGVPAVDSIYSSPESFGGAAVTPQSDQFSLGAIVYQLVTGSPAFDSIESLLSGDPAPIPPEIPAPLRWTIDRCLMKDPDARWDSTRDLYREFRAMRQYLTF
ncbi:MAG TPA: serine/threonine-protein kinase [Bryobacteraceae bacterium]|nr:serine/threonine-protein kinase [Bryobacteraceae bacterium]